MNLDQYKEIFEPILKNMKEVQNFETIKSVSLFEHEIVIFIAVKHEEETETKFEDQNLQFLYNEIKRLKKRLDDVEHSLFYQKAVAISGSTISTFFLAFSQFIGNSRGQSDTWSDYFLKLKIDSKLQKKLETINLGIAQLTKLAGLVNEKNSFSHPKVKKDKVKSLIEGLKNQKCNLKIDECYDFNYINLSDEEIKTLLEIFQISLQFQEKNQKTQIREIVKILQSK